MKDTVAYSSLIEFAVWHEYEECCYDDEYQCSYAPADSIECSCVCDVVCFSDAVAGDVCHCDREDRSKDTGCKADVVVFAEYV